MVVSADPPPLDFDRKPGRSTGWSSGSTSPGAERAASSAWARAAEKFIVRQRERLPLVKTFLPLGGTIDYEAGTLSGRQLGSPTVGWNGSTGW